MTILETQCDSLDKSGIAINFIETDDGVLCLEDRAELAARTVSKLWDIVRDFEAHCIKFDEDDRLEKFNERMYDEYKIIMEGD